MLACCSTRYNTPMILRWLIRSFAIALLTFCLSLWGWSYFYSFHISYAPSLGKTYLVHTYMGGVAFGFLSHTAGTSPGWFFGCDREALPLSDISGIRQFLGFGYFQWPIVPTGPTSRGFCIPFWFPSLLFAGLLWFVWRQTRQKIGRGFPVELTNSNHDMSTNGLRTLSPPNDRPS